MRVLVVLVLLVAVPAIAAAGPPANVLVGSPLVRWRHDGTETICNVDVAHAYAEIPDRAWRVATTYGAARPAPFSTSVDDPAACAQLDTTDLSRVQRGTHDVWTDDGAFFRVFRTCGGVPCRIDTYVEGRDLDRDVAFEERVYLGGSSQWTVSVVTLHMARAPVPG